MRALYKVEKDGAYSDKALRDEMRGLQPCDRALANELALGTLRNKLYLDFIIRSYSKLRLKKLSPWVLQILRVGVYQLVRMDKIPPSAACNESVKLAAKFAHAAAKGYVNGVMRSVAADIDKLPEPSGSEAERMSVMYSCPLWLTEKLCAQFGAEKCKAILKDSLVPHPSMLRANTLKTTSEELCDILKAEDISAEADSDVPECLRVSGAIDILHSEAYGKGLYTLQNINSMRAAIALEPEKGETVIDVCAAPGGKTTHIAELMENSGRVIAFDIHKHKLDLIEKSAERLGIDCIEVRLNNSEQTVTELVGMADRVLADVPCSGIGLIHRKPEIKYNRTETDIETICKIQEKILNSSAQYVRPGGVLVYSTCTIIEEENSAQIGAFLKRNTEFAKEFEQLYLADETGGSGFYICRMRRRG